MALLAASVCLAGSGGLYPDVDVTIVSDNHLIISYHPDLSEGGDVLGRAALIPIGDGHAWGRQLTIAVPPGGDIAFNYQAGAVEIEPLPADHRFIASEAGLVIHGGAYDARGHSLVRLYVFPQRIENNRLATYRDITIDVVISGGEGVGSGENRVSRLDSVMASVTINPQQFFTFTTAPRLQTASKAVPGMIDESATWLKIAVTENGITRITGTALSQAGVSLANLPSDSIRMFYAGGDNPFYDPTAPPPQLAQIAIRIEDGGDGLLNPGDDILFYAEGPSRYAIATGRFVYYANPYTLYNYYWLAIGGHESIPPLRWEVVNGTPSGNPDRLVTTSLQPVRIEQNRLFMPETDGHIRNYFRWYWSDQPVIATTVNLPDLVPGDSLDIEMNAARTYMASTIFLNGKPTNKFSSGGDTYHFWDTSGAGVDGLNALQINLKADGTNGSYLDYLNIVYSMRLRIGGRQISFASLGYSGQLRYRLTGYSASDYTVNIADPEHPVMVSGVQITVDTALFQLPASILTPSRFAVYSRTTAKTPASVEASDPAGLRSDLNQYDCLVISPRAFQAALQDYVDYRQATGQKRLKLVAVEDIYDNFGYGLESPLAIRSYLKFAYENYADPAPFAVLLVGDGHYDFLDNLQRHLPSFISPFIWGREHSCGDDNYVYFGKLDWLDSDTSRVHQADRGWDMMVTRWPVRSPGEVSAAVAKLKRYESPETQGSWRSRITYVADDENKGTFTGEIIHTAQSETLAVYHTPVEFVRQKIYATDYSFASNGDKPTVNDAIIRAVNDGTLILNYIGHGSPDVWADEHILKKSTDLARMQNPDKLAVVIAASCSIGFFDAPDKEGMAEMLFRQEGGAVTTVSATRLVYSADNSAFNYDLYDVLFGSRLNVAEGVFAVKMLHQYEHDYGLIVNDQAYVVFGDPLGRLGLPEYRATFASAGDSIMTPLGRFAFAGSIVDSSGAPAMTNGIAEVTVYDSPIVRTHRLGLRYLLTGPTIFRGPVSVQNGFFEGAFVVPLDVDYGGDAARIAAYGSLAGSSAIGGRDSLAIADTVSVTSDNAGPEIQYAFEQAPGFVSGGRIPARATLILRLSDSSGINLTGGLGHRIELTFDDDNNTVVNLTDGFAYLPGSYQAGEVRFPLPDLAPERHLVSVKAWDNANNPAVVDFEVIPSEEGRLAISDVMNYPNPMEETTEFFFQLSESADEVDLEIYTLSGKLIRRFAASSSAPGRNRMFFWDGRDLDGDRVAEGVYLYKLTARGKAPMNGGTADNMAEAYGKLVLLN